MTYSKPFNVTAIIREKVLTMTATTDTCRHTHTHTPNLSLFLLVEYYLILLLHFFK